MALLRDKRTYLSKFEMIKTDANVAVYNQLQMYTTGDIYIKFTNIWLIIDNIVKGWV